MTKNEIQNEISKCSRCALCLQNCPIFEITKNENNTSRGLICKLNGFFDGKLLEKEIKKDFKICLFCSKCEKNCPAKINTTKIFAHKNAQFYPSKISQRLFLFFKILPIKVLYFLNIFKTKFKSPNNEISYFKGCISKAQHKTTFLDKNYSDVDFSCCGLPYLSSGDLKNYNKAKEKNISLIKKAKMVVFDCATCKNTVENYEELTFEDKNKLILFSDLLFNKKLKIKDHSRFKNKKITFHKSCHLNQEDFTKIEKILTGIEGINYIKLENPDSCCGFGGSYFLYHPIIAIKIALKKAQTIKKSGADLILTVCPSCTIGIRFNQLISLNFKKTLELRDFISSELSAF